MPTSLTELAATIVAAQASQSMMTSQEIREVLQSTYETLAKLKASEEGQGLTGQEAASPVEDNLAQLRANPLRSISKNKVICLECGAEFSMLSGRHLASHGLTAKEYRKKWKLPARHGLVSKALSQQKREKAKELDLGNSLAAYRKRAFKKDEVKKEEPKPLPMPIINPVTIKESDIDKVLGTIRANKDGISVNRLVDKTGIDGTTIRAILEAAMEEGKIKRVSGGGMMLGYVLA